MVEFDQTGKRCRIEEKPQHPSSHYAVPGLYFYDSSVVDVAAGLKPSARGELEITDVNLHYLERGQLHGRAPGPRLRVAGHGHARALCSRRPASCRRIQERQGLKIACVEEIAYRLGYIDKEQLLRLAHPIRNNEYGQYLLRLVEEG